MKQITVSESLVIPASPEVVYKILADYQTAHPAILPKPYFSNLEIETGGVGLGTVFRLEMNVFGNKEIFKMKVVEAREPVQLIEKDEIKQVITTFDLSSELEGAYCMVRITTTAPASPGLKGWLEQWLNPPITRMIFRKQLKLLAEYVAPREGES